MNTRPVSILLLFWLVPFFAVIAPGHQRGAILLPGSDTPAVSAWTCVLCDTYTDPDGNPASPADPASNCAICKFNGTLKTPPPFSLPNLKPQRLNLPGAEPAVALLPEPAPLDRVSGRAPPSVFS